MVELEWPAITVASRRQPSRTSIGYSDHSSVGSRLGDGARVIIPSDKTADVEEAPHGSTCARLADRARAEADQTADIEVSMRRSGPGDVAGCARLRNAAVGIEVADQSATLGIASDSARSRASQDRRA